MGRSAVVLLAVAACGLPEAEPGGRVFQEILGGSKDAGAPISDVYLIESTFNTGSKCI